jgi:hypothetical protein
MSSLQDELDANFDNFHKDWTSQAVQNWAALRPLAVFRESYRRIALLNALKVDIVLPSFSAGSAAFFSEAHNDALVSHVSASFGAWRSSLKAMRSCIENTANAIYFKDHPVELEQWNRGEFRLGFTRLLSYLEAHPRLSSVDKAKTGLQYLEQEYATLSRAVHASAVGFRMTDSASDILLWNTDKARAGQWASRETKVIEGISLLFAFLFSDQLTGTQHSGVRTMLGFTISPAKRAVLKKELNISIPTP